MTETNWRVVAQRLAIELYVAREALNRVRETLTVPAAEYVPAIGDAFEIIERAMPSKPLTPAMGTRAGSKDD